MSSTTRALLRTLIAFASVLALLHVVAVIDSRPSIVVIAKDFLISHFSDSGSGGILNSNFVTSIVGALAGAFFGAWGAQKIAAKIKRRDDLLDEIRNTNAAIMVTLTITDRSLALKKQHVKPLRDNFEKQQLAFAINQTKRLLGITSPIEIHFDLRTITPTKLPLEILQNQVFEKLSVSGRPLALMTILSQSCRGTGYSTQKPQ